MYGPSALPNMAFPKFRDGTAKGLSLAESFVYSNMLTCLDTCLEQRRHFLDLFYFNPILLYWTLGYWNLLRARNSSRSRKHRQAVPQEC